MGRVQYYCASSLDGFIAESDDTLDWLTKYEPAATYADAPEDDAPMPGGYERFYEGVGALVSGSVTYEFVLGELERGEDWPYKGKPCWILTSRDLPIPDGEGVHIRMVNGPVRDHFDEMMRSAGDKHLWVVGGGNVASQFADERLLDELLVTVVPVVLGQGKPLFDRRLPGGAMQLTGVHPSAVGMVELTYQLNR
jgi:dihydrofolate reductase